jgi:catechol 2,3-dioxygenase-like lactoylglutathione lyase family enzyme
MPSIGPISCVTIAAPDLQHMIDSYHLYLGYDLVDHGRLSAAQAELWGLPNLTGRRYALMLPEGEGHTFLRFVDSKPTPGYVAFRHMGWNAAELMVQDTDGIAARLDGSPFKIIGPPADLSFSDKIRAMQALGPAQESIYLTSFKEKMAEFDVPDARHYVDRVFIVILGGASVEAINDFYQRHFNVATAPVMPAVISVLSNAQGLPADTRHDLAALALQGQCYIEADRMPPATLPRIARDGELPPAIAMVSFAVKQFPEGLDWLAPPRALPQAPYHGRRAGVCVGAAGEWIELIEGAA